MDVPRSSWGGLEEEPYLYISIYIYPIYRYLFISLHTCWHAGNDYFLAFVFAVALALTLALALAMVETINVNVEMFEVERLRKNIYPSPTF